MLRLPGLLLSSLLLLPVISAGAPRGSELMQAIHSLTLDPAQCYTVHELNFNREDIKLYLTAGHLLFAPPVEGRTVAAVFVADVEGGDAELLLVPPNRAERQSLSRYIESPTLNIHFSATLLLFTDDTGSMLLERVKEAGFSKAPDRGALLVNTWTSILRNVSESFQLRMVQDLLSRSEKPVGFFFAALQSPSLGNLELLVDPAASEQITVGQTNHRQNRTVFDIWTNFQARSQRQQAPKSTPDSVDNIRIEATLADNLSLQVTTRATLTPSPKAQDVLSFDLAHQMRILSAKIDGQPVEVIERDQQRAQLSRERDDETFLLVPPQALAPGRSHEVEIQQEGTIIQEAGRQIYFVNARATWYPRQHSDLSRYELTFRYPRRFDLVATGDLVEDAVEGDRRKSRFRTATPVRHVGFNLGVYDKTVVARGPYRVELYSNKGLEPALQPTPAMTVPPARPPGFAGRRVYTGTETNVAALPRPVSARETLASDVADSLTFMSARFGPLPLKVLAVSPVPAAFGQGFPGLVYLSTLAYLKPEDRPASMRSEMQNLFFTDLLQAHETAHQWWGNSVGSATPADDWLVEALANYAAILYVEKKRGTAAVERILTAYREDLLRKGEAVASIESSGPIIWGPRLRQTQEPNAWRIITYEKGSWIIHMLRRRMGDERFYSFLADLHQRFQGQLISTAQFQQVAQKFLPANAPERTLDGFFEQWVYGTGIPSLSLKASAKGVAPKVRVSGTLEQKDVEEDFTTWVPVEAQMGRGRSVVHWVATGSEPAQVNFAIPAVPSKIVLDPGNSTLHR